MLKHYANIIVKDSDGENLAVYALLFAELWLKRLSIAPLCLAGGFMALIEWKKEYSIGVTALDNQHKKIIIRVVSIAG